MDFFCKWDKVRPRRGPAVTKLSVFEFPPKDLPPNYAEYMLEGKLRDVTVLVSVVTDNRDRATSEIGKLFHKHGGGVINVEHAPGMFRMQGQIFVPKPAAKDDEDVILRAVTIGEGYFHT